MKVILQKCLVSASFFFALLALNPPPLLAQTFQATTGTMQTPRVFHTAAALTNGKVLLSGGCGGSDQCKDTTSAELYDPLAGTFSTTGSLHYAREAATATLLNNGMVLIVGGSAGPWNNIAILSSAELYNPASGTFTVTGTMKAARVGHTATLLTNGTVLISGGYNYTNYTLASSEIYNPATGTFTATGNLHTARQQHTATALSSGLVLIAGGGGGVASAELYNPANGTYTITGGLNQGRGQHTATILLDSGKVLIAGGTYPSTYCAYGHCYGVTNYPPAAELYDPTTGSFTVSGNLHTPRTSHTATLLTNGKALIAGGYAGGYATSGELYDPTTGTFTATGSLNTGRAYHTATIMNSGVVLVAGGSSGTNPDGSSLITASAELYFSGVMGSIGPKYVVLAVVYAPPGSRSSVDYGASTMMGTSTSIGSSFSNSNNLTVSVGGGTSIFGLGETVTGTSSTTFTEESDSSKSIDISKTTSNDTIVAGPASDAVGVDHDFDTVYIWLNPVVNLTFKVDGTFEQTGFNYDMTDPCFCMDVIPLQVIQLKNPALITDQNTLHYLARTWAPNLADGSGPGLTNADLLSIAAADPWGSNPSYTITPVVEPDGSICTTDGRFCQADSEDIPYAPPGPGGQPATNKGVSTYSKTTTNGTGGTDTRQQGFSIDFNAKSGFITDLSLDIKVSDTLTWTNKWSASNTQKAGQSASWSVTGPAGSANYQGPTLFNVYQDNVYGTFMFFPHP